MRCDPGSIRGVADTRERRAEAGGGALRSLLGLGGTAAGAGLRPLRAGVGLGVRIERELRLAAARRASATLLDGVDAVLASRLAAELVERVLASDLARRTVGTALSGPLVDAVARDLTRYGVPERVAERLLADGVLERAAERLLQTDELWLIVDEVASSPSVAEAVTRQSAGFVDELAGGVRAQSRSADTWLESRVRNVFARRSRAAPPDDG